jgi:hypothetical protein
MDSDDVCAPDRVERQMAHLAGRPWLSVVGCAVDVFQDEQEAAGEGERSHTEHAAPSKPRVIRHPTLSG